MISVPCHVDAFRRLSMCRSSFEAFLILAKCAQDSQLQHSCQLEETGEFLVLLRLLNASDDFQNGWEHLCP